LVRAKRLSRTNPSGIGAKIKRCGGVTGLPQPGFPMGSHQIAMSIAVHIQFHSPWCSQKVWTGLLLIFRVMFQFGSSSQQLDFVP
jgi:hypothetical protein